MANITIHINGVPQTLDVEPRLLLVHLIRENLSLTGTHVGCDTSSCGACTVLMDGRSVKSCTVYAVQANGKEIMTIEGLAQGGLHPLQEGFKEEHGLQCGLHPWYDHALCRFVGTQPESNRGGNSPGDFWQLVPLYGVQQHCERCTICCSKNARSRGSCRGNRGLRSCLSF